MKRSIPFLLMVVFLLSCSFQMPEKGVYYTASTVYSLQQFNIHKEFGHISMVYIYPTTPSYSKVVVERLDRSGNFQKVIDTFDVENPQNITDVDTLYPDEEYLYPFKFLDGGLHVYDTVKARTLPIIEILSPSDTVTTENDTIVVRWKTITFENERYTSYTVEIQPDIFDMDNPGFSPPLYKTDIEVTGDTGEVYVPMQGEWGNLFTLKISTVRELKYLQNNAVSYRAFVWVRK